MRFSAILLLILSCLHARTQPFRLFMKNGKSIGSQTIEFTEVRGGKNIRVISDSLTTLLDSIELIENKFAKFEIRKSRRRVLLGRVLETGFVNLYDFPDIRKGNANYYNRIHSSRLYYRLQDDSVLRPLRRKEFSKVFNSAFAASYPAFGRTVKAYSRLNTLNLVSLFMLTGGELAVGAMQGGGAALIIAYTGIAVGGMVYARVSRQLVLRNMRTMVAALNKAVQGK